MFESAYQQSAERSLESLVSTVDVNTLVKPERTPQKVWESLTPDQKCRIVLKKRQRSVITNLQTLLADEDRIQILYADEGVTGEDANLLKVLWSNSVEVESNPTNADVARYIVKARQSGIPPKFLLTQCIKSPEVKKNDFLRFSGKEASRPSKFVRGLEPKGWTRARNILDAWPASKMDLMLGDMDFYTLDRCPEWWPGCEAQIRAESLALRSDIQAKADVYFGPERVNVGLWSEQYTVEQFTQGLERVRASEAWRTPRWLKYSREQYRRWGYAFSPDQDPQCATERFRVDGEERTRAGYKIEACIVMSRKAIQCWAEAGDVLAFSDYDGSGLPPSLILSNS